MKLLLSIALLASLVLTGLIIPTSAQSLEPCTPSTCTMSAERIVETNDWGTTLVTDTVRINTTTPAASYLDVGVPSPIAEKMGFLGATNGQGQPLPVAKRAQNQTGGYVPIRVDLAGVAGSHTIVLKTAFSEFLTFNTSTSNYTLTYSPFPVVDGSVTVSTATVIVRIRDDWTSVTWSEIEGTRPDGNFQASTNNLGPYNTTLGKISFNSNVQNDLSVTADRVLTISRAAKLLVVDTYRISNRGRDISSLAILLPKGAVSISGSDAIGRLEAGDVRAATQSNGTSIVTFTPRFGTVKNGGGTTLRLEYELFSEGYVAAGPLGKYSLNLRKFDNVKFVQSSLQTKIVTPTGFRLEAVTPEGFNVSSNDITFQSSGISPLTDLSFSLSYRLDPFWSSLSPLIWTGLVEAALVATLLVFRGLSLGTTAVGAAPSSLIGRLVNLLDEKLSLRLESEKLEEDMARGALGRHDFKRRRRTVDIRVSELDRQIGPLKQELTTTSQRYADLLRRLEKAEAELQVVRSSMSDLRSQYRGGRLTKDSYESLNSDHIRRKDRAQQTIDNIVIGLREEAR